MHYSHICKRHSSKMFQTWGTRFEFVAPSQTAPARALGLELQSSRHVSPPWKKWVIPAYNKKKRGATVRCVFICVCVCTWKCQWAGLAAAAKKGNGVKREEWRCYKLGDVHKGPSVQDCGSCAYAFFDLPQWTPPGKGNLPFWSCPGWAHLNNTTNKEKVSAEITQGEPGEERKNAAAPAAGCWKWISSL